MEVEKREEKVREVIKKILEGARGDIIAITPIRIAKEVGVPVEVVRSILSNCIEYVVKRFYVLNTKCLKKYAEA